MSHVFLYNMSCYWCRSCAPLRIASGQTLCWKAATLTQKMYGSRFRLVWYSHSKKFKLELHSRFIWFVCSETCFKTASLVPWIFQHLRWCTATGFGPVWSMHYCGGSTRIRKTLLGREIGTRMKFNRRTYLDICGFRCFSAGWSSNVVEPGKSGRKMASTSAEVMRFLYTEHWWRIAAKQSLDSDSDLSRMHRKTARCQRPLSSMSFQNVCFECKLYVQRIDRPLLDLVPKECLWTNVKSRVHGCTLMFWIFSVSVALLLELRYYRPVPQSGDPSASKRPSLEVGSKVEILAWENAVREYLLLLKPQHPLMLSQFTVFPQSV